jgi:S1-C subfamily serine protease
VQKGGQVQVMTVKRSTENSGGPRKIPKLNGAAVLGEPAMEDDSPLESDNDSEMADVYLDHHTQGQSHQWHTTIDNVVKCVVAVHFSQVSNFDCDAAVLSEATGFVVDAERGIILTNRHVVGTGPFVGSVIFDNHEEVDVIPIYRDPVHDFGFLKFNPKDIKYMDVKSLELKPELAQVGCEIRVVGNDAGEKLSILSGFISRLDRDAPAYGDLTYNDFNTEYIQAAASASGGSSGSPVVSIDGYAVALQAGGSTEASTDFFLPLWRVVRALQCIQEGEPITRGTIQVQWTLKPYDECRRFGLTDEAERRARERFPKSIGLLCAELILPKGPADGLIQEGDTLISVNGTHISTFITVDDILDSSVGKEIELSLQRGGEDITVKCTVGDLHAITPDRYLEVAGASFNNLSYQMARLYAIPVKGVFLNNATGSFFLNRNESIGWILDSVNDVDIEDLDQFIEVMKSIPDRSRIPITFRHISDMHSNSMATIYVDRHWCSSFRLAVRNDTTGLWDYQELGDPLPPVPPQPKPVRFVDIPVEHPGCAQLSKSFMVVTTFIHVPVDSFPSMRKRGYGVVIDAAKGYLLCSRLHVPHDCLDIQITVAESFVIPGSVVFLHPTHNFTIVKYDPSLIHGDVQTPNFSDVPLKRGDKCMFIGFNHNFRVVSAETKISDISSLNIPRNSYSPRYRGTNLETVSLTTSLSDECGSGVVADNDGTIRAFWLSFLGENREGHDAIYKMGIDVTEVNHIIKQLQTTNEIPRVKIVDCEFYAISLDQARVLGVTDEWIKKVEDSGKDRFQFMAVSRSAVPEDQHKPELEHRDVVLAINGKQVFDQTDINRCLDEDVVNFKIVRRKKEMDIEVPTVEVKPTDHIVIWSAVVVQAPHHAVRQAMLNLPSQVYVTARPKGSPVAGYGINPTNFITHVNGIATPTVPDFVKVVRTIGTNTYCKLRLVSFDNVPFAISVKTNYHYFPTGELKKDPITNKWIDIEYAEDNTQTSEKKI